MRHAARLALAALLVVPTGCDRLFSAVGLPALPAAAAAVDARRPPPGVWRALSTGTTAPLRGVWGTGPDAVFAAGGEGTILRSVDHGRSFTRLASGSTDLLTAVTGSGADDLAVLAPDAPALFTSRDGGTIWTRTRLPLPKAADLARTLYGGGAPRLFATSLALDSDGRLLLAGGALVDPSMGPSMGDAFLGFVEASGDAGKSWKRLAVAAIAFSGLDCTAAGDLLAYGTSGVVSSSDRGATWSQLLDLEGSRLAVAGAWQSPRGDVVVALATTSDLVVAERSTDRGASWTPIVVTARRGLAAGFSLWGSDDGTLVAAGPGGALFRSLDAGLTWTAEASSTTADLSAVWGPSATDVYVAGDRGLLLHFD